MQASTFQEHPKINPQNKPTQRWKFPPRQRREKDMNEIGQFTEQGK